MAHWQNAKPISLRCMSEFRVFMARIELHLATFRLGIIQQSHSHRPRGLPFSQSSPLEFFFFYHLFDHSIIYLGKYVLNYMYNLFGFSRRSWASDGNAHGLSSAARPVLGWAWAFKLSSINKWVGHELGGRKLETRPNVTRIYFTEYDVSKNR